MQDVCEIKFHHGEHCQASKLLRTDFFSAGFKTVCVWDLHSLVFMSLVADWCYKIKARAIRAEGSDDKWNNNHSNEVKVASILSLFLS